MVKDEIDRLAKGCFVLGDVTFVIEEIDACCTAWVMPEWMNYCVQRGRHKNIELIGVTPAPFGINRDLTRQAKRICVFNTNEPKDLDYLAALLGSDVKQIVPALGQWEFLQWQDVSGDHLGDELMVGRVDGDNLSFRGCHDKPGSGYEIQAGGQLEPGDEKDRRAGAGQARPGNRRLGRDDVPAARRSDL